MIDVREAVQIAQSYLLQLFPGEAEDVRLEEVELSRGDSGSEWQVTLSFFRRNEVSIPAGSLGQILGATAKRHFKTFTINANDKQVRAMRIRAV